MSDQNLLDEQLVEQVQRGDKNAFNLLVRKYQHKVVNLVAGMSTIRAMYRMWRRRHSSSLPCVADIPWRARLHLVVPDCRQHGQKHLTSQGRRPPSSDVEADRLNIMVVVKPCKRWPPRKTWR